MILINKRNADKHSSEKDGWYYPLPLLPREASIFFDWAYKTPTNFWSKPLWVQNSGDNYFPDFRIKNFL